MKYYPLLLLLPLLLAACSKKVSPTLIEIKDSIRHCAPILQGSQLELTYNIENKGPNPLLITDIQSSCGCIIVDRYMTVIPVGREGVLKLVFDSSKFLGYVSNQIRLYGNMLPSGEVLLEFDLDVVSHSDALCNCP